MDEYIDAHGWTGSMNPSVDRPVGRQMNFLHRFLSILQTAPPPPAWGLSCMVNTLTTQYMLYTFLCLHKLPHLISFASPTNVYRHTYIYTRTRWPIMHFILSKTEDVLPETATFELYFVIFSTSIFIPFCPFCVDTSNKKIYCQDLL